MRLRNLLLSGVAALSLMAAACTSSESPESEGDGPESTTTAAGSTSTAATSVPVPEVLEGGVFRALGEPGVGGRSTSLSFDPSGVSTMLVGGDMLGIARAEDPLLAWESTTGLLSWEIAEFTWSPTDPAEVWVGTMSGPHRSTDGGRTWAPAREGFPPLDPSGFSAPVEVVLFDPAIPGRLLAFGGSQRQWQRESASLSSAYGSVWESTDGGASWSELAVLPDRPSIQAADVNVDGSAVFAAGLGQGIFRSTDGGRSWSVIGDGLPHGFVSDLAVHPTDPDVVWASLTSARVGGAPEPGGLYRSDDGGDSWEQLEEGLGEQLGGSLEQLPSYERIVVAPSDPDRLYTGNVGQGQVAIHRSDDGGASWTLVADGSTERTYAYQSAPRGREIAVHPGDADVVAFSQDDYILGSFDGGGSWVDLTTQEAEAGHFVGRGYSGLVSSDVAFHPDRPGVLALSAFDGGNVILSTDDGLSWTRPITEEAFNWGGAEEIRFAGDNVYALLGQSTATFRGIGVSVDGGVTFEIRHGSSVGLPETRTDLDPTGITVDPNDGQHVVAAVGGVVYRSTDGAGTFDVVFDNIDGADDVEFSPDGSTLWISSAGGVYASTDGGQTAGLVSGSPSGVTRITVIPERPAELLVTQFQADGGGLVRYDGSTWTLLNPSSQIIEVATQPGSPEVMVAASSDQPRRDRSLGEGVLVSLDGGATWTAYNEGLPMPRIATVEFDPHQPDRLVVGTNGRGFYEVLLSSLISG